MRDYWTPEHNAAIKEYFYASSDEVRNGIIDKCLHKPLYEIARRSLTNMSIKPTLEIQQDIVIHLLYKTMPRLREDKLQAAFQFLWTSARNYILTHVLRNPIRRIETLELSHCYQHYSYAEDPIDQERDKAKQISEIQQRAIGEIDLRLKGQLIANTTNSVFLMLLRDYLIANDYDVRGFGDYVRKAMHLKHTSYNAICCRLGLRTKGFNEKLK